MLAYSDLNTPLDWPVLVAEALRRRKAEKLTQREHAALADVSIPTIVAFDRGELTLSLHKAFDILRVVGLVAQRREADVQEQFVIESLQRWRNLTDARPARAPERFPDGWYQFDYALEGDLKRFDLSAFVDVLRKAETRHTGWPVFWVPTRPEIAPKVTESAIECWLEPPAEGEDRALYDPAHCDFWRALPTGRLFLIRGYQEDAQETFKSHTIFDAALPIWRIGEGLLHAASLVRLMEAFGATGTMIHFRARYTGLSGRVLRAWSSPEDTTWASGAAARSDEAAFRIEAAAADIPPRLSALLTPAIAGLYERFGVTGIAESRVGAVVERLLESRIDRGD